MGTLAVRQGDPLFFARSLVWSFTMQISDEIKNQPVHVRMAEFYKLWKLHRQSGDFKVTQENADLIANLCNVPAPRVNEPDNDDPALGTWNADRS
jgi:hypothetical protein